MMAKQEIVRWLNTLPEDAQIGVDEGGQCLEEHGGDAYLEIGGLPEDEEDGDDATRTE